MTKPAAVGYARLSDKSEQSTSIPSQKKRIAEYCERYGLELLETFVDDGKSGWTFDRPGFRKLEAFCKQKSQVKYLIIVHFDRFSRADPIDAMVKERYFRDKLKVKVLMISEPIELDTDNPLHQMMRFLQAYQANQERRNIIERTKAGMRFKMLQGQYCGTAPFGYKNFRDENRKPSIIIDESRAAIIRNIFDLFLKGCSYEHIRKIAVKQGFTVQGNSVIQSVLGNPVYAGMISVPAYNDQPQKLVQGKHIAIVPEDIYWKAQARLNPRRFVPQKRDEVPLRGVLRCRACGKLMTAAPSKSRSGRYYWYYFCNDDRKENYSAIKVHEWLNQVLIAISIRGEYFNKLKEKLSDTISKMINNQTKDLMQVNLNIRTGEQVIEKIEGRYLLGNVSEETYIKIIGEKRAALAELYTKKELLSMRASDYLGRLDNMLKKASSIRTFYNEMDLVSKQIFIRQVFGNELKLTPEGLRTRFIHPVFEINNKSVNGLPITIQKETPPFEGENASVSPGGVLPNREFLESVLAIFAA